MAISLSPLNGSHFQPNFPRLRQMDSNRKRMPMPETSEICKGVRLGSKNFTFGVDWPILHPTWQPNEGIIQKAQRCLILVGYILYWVVKTTQKLAKPIAMPQKRWRLCIHPRTCARR